MKIFRRVLLTIILILVLVATVIILNGYKLYKTSIEEVSLKDKIANLENDVNYTFIKDVALDYKNAVVAVEDHRFYDHGAIDVFAIGRAIISNIQAGDFNEGGSTITQQVAKNLYFIEEDNVINRKIAEVFLAMDLEKNYDKDKVLELYMNTIYFGEGYYGIKEASKGYYNKEPKDMNLYESSMLAGVPNAPSAYAPTVNPELAKSRQGKVIRSMVEYGYLSQEQADAIQE